MDVLWVILVYGQDAVYERLLLDMDSHSYYPLFIWTRHSVVEVIVGYGQDTVY